MLDWHAGDPACDRWVGPGPSGPGRRSAKSGAHVHPRGEVEPELRGLVSGVFIFGRNSCAASASASEDAARLLGEHIAGLVRASTTQESPSVVKGPARRQPTKWEITGPCAHE